MRPGARSRRSTSRRLRASAVLAKVGSSDEAFKAAMGSLMRVDSPATKCVRELLRNRCVCVARRLSRASTVVPTQLLRVARAPRCAVARGRSVRVARRAASLALTSGRTRPRALRERDDELNDQSADAVDGGGKDDALRRNNSRAVRPTTRAAMRLECDATKLRAHPT